MERLVDILYEFVGLVRCIITGLNVVDLIRLVWGHRNVYDWYKLVCYDVILGYNIHGVRDFKDILRLQLALLSKKGSGCRGKQRTCNLKLMS